MRADLRLDNARDILTGAPVTLAIAGGRILATGASALALPAAQVIDAAGRWVSPGFIESHAHVFAGGAALGQLNLADVMGEAALARALAGFLPGLPPGDLACCYGAQYTLLGPDRPTRADLDRLCPDRPLLITATDYHCAWANTAALAAAGILQGADPGPGAEVVMAPDGRASGELREFAAMALIKRLSPSGGREALGLSGEEPGPVTDTMRQADSATILRALQHCLRLGITSVVNMDGNLYQADLLAALDARGLLPLHLSLPMTLTATQTADRQQALLDRAMAPPGARLSFGRVKMFMDGVFDTWTAVVLGGYPDRPDQSGTPLFDAETFARLCIQADRRRLQIAVHAVGDGAVRRVLDGYAAARAAHGPRASRHRIEHIDTIHPDDIPRLADLGVIASMQPVHPPGSAGLPLEPTISLMGRARWPFAFPWAMLRDAGIPIAFGTDWPVSPLDPLHAIHCALSRRPWADDMPDQRLTFAQCWQAYTSTGAYADQAETRRGTLAPGQQADIILLEGDPNRLAQDLGALRVTLTLCAGDLRFAAP